MQFQNNKTRTNVPEILKSGFIFTRKTVTWGHGQTNGQMRGRGAVQMTTILNT